MIHRSLRSPWRCVLALAGTLLLSAEPASAQRGAIAIVASALLADSRVPFVFLGACGDWVKGRDDVDVRGRILSIYEASDELGTSCEPLFVQASAQGTYREVRITTGAGHGAFDRPRAEWLVPKFALVERQATP